MSKSGKKLSYGYVFNEFSKRGYTLLSPTYRNAHQELPYVCHKHPGVLQTIIYNSIQRGSGCWFCGIEGRGKRRRLTLDKVRTEVTKRGLLFDSICGVEEQLNSKTYVNYVCQKHPDVIQQMRYNNIQQGYGCPLCYEEKEKKFVFLKGGTTPIREYLRECISEWKELSKKVSGYACILTDSKKYEIHHHYPFDLIMQEAFRNLSLEHKPTIAEYSNEEAESLIREVQRLHAQYGPGVCLKSSLHKKLHSLYGYRNIITYEQFQEFTDKYHLGTLFGSSGENSDSTANSSQQQVVDHF